MLLVLLFTMAGIGAMTYAAWPVIKDAWKEDGRPSTAAAEAGPVRPHAPESLEGALVGQLAAAEITRRQYIHAMEGLAARDAARHPLTVPPETGSAA